MFILGSSTHWDRCGVQQGFRFTEVLIFLPGWWGGFCFLACGLLRSLQESVFAESSTNDLGSLRGLQHGPGLLGSQSVPWTGNL